MSGNAAKESDYPMPVPTSQEHTVSTSSNEHIGIVMYTTRWCGDCRRAKRIFAALDVPYSEVNIEEHEDAAAFVARVNNGQRRVPTILFPDGTKLVEPANATLEAKLATYTGVSQ